MAPRYDKHLLNDAFPDDRDAIRLIMDMLKATASFPGHSGGFSKEPRWEGNNRAGYTYFLGSSSGPDDPSFENNRTLKRDITPKLRDLGFINPSQVPNIVSGFWQFTPEALEWYGNNSGPTDDEVRKRIGRIIAHTDPMNDWSHYQAETLAEEIGISSERVFREVSVLTDAEFLERRRVSSTELGPLRFAKPKGVIWAANDFPPIGTVGLHQTTVNVSVSVQVIEIIEQARETSVSKEQLLQFEALLQRAAAELEKPQGKGKYEAVKDLVAFAANLKELVPLAGKFVAENGDKIQGLADTIGNIISG